ncbi:MAG TPA: hypothetical protein VLB32_08330 [Candidatus Acidoferrales bacterium]|nr:hypothetical protein [Candidatus Acidoferrales bacterium]
MKRWVSIPLLALALAGAACGGGAKEDELERLRRENEALRARQQQQTRGPVPVSSVARHFTGDVGGTTLAGLMPGFDIAMARDKFGAETTTRSWQSEGRTIVQHEWQLEDGVVLRVNAGENGRIERVAAVLANPKGVNIPTLNGLNLGQETYASLQRRFGPLLTTELLLWGAQGLYTVAQRMPFGEHRRMEFAFEMPAGMSRAELERIGDEVQNRNNASVLEPHLRDAAPYMVALEETR